MHRLRRFLSRVSGSVLYFSRGFFLAQAQAAKIRAALIVLDSNENGKAVLKNIALAGFREASSQGFVEFLKWLGDLEVDKRLVEY